MGHPPSIISLSGESPIASGFDSLVGKIATLAETGVEELALPVTATATALDATAHNACSAIDNPGILDYPVSPF